MTNLRQLNASPSARTRLVEQAADYRSDRRADSRIHH
jgi:hypothetical protein